MTSKQISLAPALACALSLSLALSLSVSAAEPVPPATKPAATKPAAPAWPADKPAAPATLPGNGLSQHDFLYAGEAKTRDIYIVRKGAVAWSYHDDAGKGEISDAMLQPNGNVLIAHQFAVKLIDPAKKVLWNFEAPPKCEIHTAQMIGTERVLFIINGPEPKWMVVNTSTGKTEREASLPVKNKNSTHGQFRHARLTDAGTLLVAHMDLGKVAEYDETGKEVWSATPAGGCWAAERLKNGNTLVTGNRSVREINAAGETVWLFTPEDIPDYKVAQFQIATRLANGNTLVNNWVNSWSTKIDPNTAPVQAWEVTPDKKVVWALRSWQEPAPLGPATTIQVLDAPIPAENGHFGSLK